MASSFQSIVNFHLAQKVKVIWHKNILTSKGTEAYIPSYYINLCNF